MRISIYKTFWTSLSFSWILVAVILSKTVIRLLRDIYVQCKRETLYCQLADLHLSYFNEFLSFNNCFQVGCFFIYFHRWRTPTGNNSSIFSWNQSIVVSYFIRKKHITPLSTLSTTVLTRIYILSVLNYHTKEITLNGRGKSSINDHIRNKDTEVVTNRIYKP